jgi:hypothetical protein
MEEIGNTCTVFVENTENLKVIGRCSQEDNIKRVRGCGLDSSGSGQGPVAGSCEQGNEPSGSIKDAEFLG